MKILQKIAVLGLSLGLFVSASSCVVLLERKHDNGKHKGHYKNWPKHNKKNKGTVIIIKESDSNGNNGNNGNKGGKGKGHGKKK